MLLSGKHDRCYVYASTYIHRYAACAFDVSYQDSKYRCVCTTRPQQLPNNMQIFLSTVPLTLSEQPGLDYHQVAHGWDSLCDLPDFACRVIPIFPCCNVFTCCVCLCYLHGIAVASTKGVVSASSSPNCISCGSVCPQSVCRK